MAVFIDRKYLLMISSRLDRFAQKKEDLFNFRCPFCGDSKKNKLKARGYVFRKNNDYFYTCHNCNASTTFSKFLKHVDEDLHRQYSLERYSNGENGKSNYQKPVFNLDGPKASDVFKTKLKLNDIKLKSVDKLPVEHYAPKYIQDRQIPRAYWSEIFYTNAFKDFLNSTFPDHGKEDVPNDSRIILFYTNEKGEITNVAGRALGDSKIRYCTVKISDEKKLFGLHRLNQKETVYVLEGQFDSFFVPNSVASGDSNLGAVPEFLSESECVLIFDVEPRNKEIVKQIERSVNAGKTVCLLPHNLPGKDINEMVMNGMSEYEVMNIIRENTFQGLTSKLKFAEWRKC